MKFLMFNQYPGSARIYPHVSDGETIMAKEPAVDVLMRQDNTWVISVSNHCFTDMSPKEARELALALEAAADLVGA